MLHVACNSNLLELLRSSAHGDQMRALSKLEVNEALMRVH